MKNPRKLLLTVFVLGLLSTIAVAVAGSTFSVLYGKFNVDTWTDYELDQEYTAVTIDIKNLLTYNGTTSNPLAKVAFTNDTGATPEGINILLKDDNTIEVWKLEGATEVKLATGSWEAGNSTRITFGGGYVTVYSNYDNKATKATTLEDFAFDNTIAYLRVKGGTDYVTDGYVQVEVAKGVAGMGNVISDWLPSIISLAMLGMVVGVVKKLKG